MNINESIVEDAALECFGALGYAAGHGASFAGLRRAMPSLAPARPAVESACPLPADRWDLFGEVPMGTWFLGRLSLPHIFHGRMLMPVSKVALDFRAMVPNKKQMEVMNHV